MTRPTDLVMPFADSVEYQVNGGNQDTLYSWFGNPSHILEDGTSWLWVSTTIPMGMEEREHRFHINCEKPLCAAPIVKTEV